MAVQMKHKKMFWLNVVLSIFYVLACAAYFLSNGNSYRVNLLEIISDFFFLITPIVTAVTFYKSILVRTSLILNSFTSLIYIALVGFVLIEGLGSIFDWVTLLIIAAPFLVNVKQLYGLKRLNPS